MDQENIMMKLNIENLQKCGGFVGSAVEREISWTVGKDKFTFQVLVKKPSYATFMAEMESRKQNASSQEVTARRIVTCFYNEDGSPLFKKSDITGINEDGSPVMILDEKTGQQREQGAICESLLYELLGVMQELSETGKEN